MDIQRWQKFSLNEQMGNIGSEVSRACLFEEKQDLIQRDKALERVLEMIDAMIDQKRYPSRLKEICRLRELVADLYSHGGNYQVSLNDLLSYLMPFALLARK
ncbi:MAG TPA: hypothetical protein VJG65_01270 [Patescibacteria group bacterium]|nr:hypothetical protein [Patescibacteria group bacterium]